MEEGAEETKSLRVAWESANMLVNAHQLTEGWGTERMFAVAFVVAFPVVACGCCTIWRCFRCAVFCDIPAGRLMYWTVGLTQAVVVGFAIGTWAHWVPCLWLACDLGEDDDPDLRVFVWILVSAGVASVLLLSFVIGMSDPLCMTRWRGGQRLKQ